MSKLESFVIDLQYYLSKNKAEDYNIIRKHSKKLVQLGDLSFPLDISNWFQLLPNYIKPKDTITIFDNINAGISSDEQCKKLKEASKNWSLPIDGITIMPQNAHLFFQRSSVLFTDVLREVLDVNKEFGSEKYLRKNFKIESPIPEKNLLNYDLTLLRLEILKNTATNLIKTFSLNKSGLPDFVVHINLSHKLPSQKTVLCGPVLNENGMKTLTTAEQIFQKRASDMRMMAQHKYGIQIQKISSWENYFEQLGKACVKIEMLANKSQKPIKITLNDLQTANKGASFIFYNCARIATLLKEFDRRVEKQIYPELPQLENVDFSSIKQPEEWELFYVYILQYPILTKSCIKDIEKGILSPHYLVAFLSNLCSVFSGYYRRIRILTDPREHLFGVLHARIYLIKGIQYIFHHSLSLMEIEPVKEM